jgi:hypothetical protein
MSYVSGRLRRWALGLAGLLALAGPVFAFAFTGLESFALLEPGQWQLRDSTGAPRSICVRDPTQFIQLEHAGISCSHQFVADNHAGVIVQYYCPGRDHGRTSIRVETPRLARIATWGLIDGRPFSYRVLAQKVGSC